MLEFFDNCLLNKNKMYQNPTMSNKFFKRFIIKNLAEMVFPSVQGCKLHRYINY